MHSRAVRLSPYHDAAYQQWKRDPHRHHGNVVVDNRIKGTIDPQRLDRALARLSQDYFLLHSVVTEIDAAACWIARQGARVSLDWYPHSLTERELQAYAATPFDLHTEVPFCVALIRHAADEFQMVMVIHQLLMDWSRGRSVCQLVVRYYNDEHYHCHRSVSDQLDAIAAFSAEHAERIDKAGHCRQFWGRQLEGLVGPDLHFLQLSSAKQRPVEDIGAGEVTFSFDQSTTLVLRRATRAWSTTPYLFSLAVFAAALFRHTRQECFGMVVPMPIGHPESFLFGASINPVIFPVRLRSNMTVRDWLDSTTAFFCYLRATHCQNTPIQQLASQQADNSVLDTGFCRMSQSGRMLNFSGTLEEAAQWALKPDLRGNLLFVQDRQDGQLCFRVFYRQTVIDRQLLENFVAVYCQLFLEMLNDLSAGRADRIISSYALQVVAAATAKVPQVHNPATIAAPATDQTLLRAFERQVLQTPEAVALQVEDRCWTYQQINAAANRLAQLLTTSCQIRLEDRLVLAFQPGHHAVISMLAVWKVGGAFVSIDPRSPPLGIARILQASTPRVVVTDRHCFHFFDRLTQGRAINVVNLDTRQVEFELESMSPDNGVSIAGAHSLACLFYPGAIGTAKSFDLRGVMLEHHSLLHVVDAIINANGLGHASVGAKIAPFSSDQTIGEVFSMLLCGGKVQMIRDQDKVDVRWMNDVLQRHNVTFAILPGRLAENFCSLRNETLQSLMVGCAKMKPIRPQRYDVIRFYGKTETAGLATMIRLDDEASPQAIGQPIPYSLYSVVDERLRILPVGAIGELLLGGAGVARGYHNQPDLTAQYFVRDPSAPTQGWNSTDPAGPVQRFFRTGDLVRQLPDGNLELVGYLRR